MVTATGHIARCLRAGQMASSRSASSSTTVQQLEVGRLSCQMEAAWSSYNEQQLRINQLAYINKANVMKKAAVTKLSSETPGATHNISEVQFETDLKVRGIESVAEAAATFENTNKDSLQIRHESGSETSPQVNIAPHHGLSSTLKNLFVSVMTFLQRNRIQLINLQYENTVGDSDSLKMENIDAKKAQERKAAMEMIERYKTTGM